MLFSCFIQGRLLLFLYKELVTHHNGGESGDIIYNQTNISQINYSPPCYLLVSTYIT